MTPESSRQQMESGAPPIGVIVIDKPAGWTSHDVVARIRKRLDTRKVGHLGTLDPMATGVLPVTIGRATRLARFIPSSPKEYTGRIRLGWATATADAEGERAGPERPVTVDRGAVAAAMSTFLGAIEQVPPAYSAKKIGGVRAYRLARKGENVPMRTIHVEIEAFDLVWFDPPELDFRVVCSGGTYVRSLARDLGTKLETGGHLAALRRTQSGPFSIQDAVEPDGAGLDSVIPPGRILKDLPRIEVDPELEERIRHGGDVPCPQQSGNLCIFNKKGGLIAVATAEKGWAHPEVVLL